jgi:asparagine synthase (glutamine-hydrolysing)
LTFQIDQAKDTYAGLLRGHPLSFAVFRQAPWHHYALAALEQSQLLVRSPFLDNDLIRTLFRAPDSTFQNDAICLRLIADGRSALRNIWTDRGPLGRSPWITCVRSIIEFLRKSEYAYDYGMPQWVARADHLLSALHLERLFLGRQKISHFRLWYRDALSGYVREMLLDRRTLARPYLEPKAAEMLVNSHVSGQGNHTIEIHKLLTLELTHRLFVDPQPASSSYLAGAGQTGSAT